MPRTHGTREATLYDAVAERVSSRGLISGLDSRPLAAHSSDSDSQDGSSSPRRASRSRSRGGGGGGVSFRPRQQPRHAAPLRPEEVLFRSRGAPDRYEEDDIYAADRWLLPEERNQALPDSDLVKAVHAYASDFYARATPTAGADDFRSMDETALLACGILLEEACREVLGEHGALVLTEAYDDWRSESEGSHGGTDGAGTSQDATTNDEERTEGSEGPRKRRRLDVSSDGNGSSDEMSSEEESSEGTDGGHIDDNDDESNDSDSDNKDDNDDEDDEDEDDLSP